MMTMVDIKALKEGDRVRNDGSGEVYLIIYAAPKEWPVAIRSLTVTNPTEWTKVSESTDI